MAERMDVRELRDAFPEDNGESPSEPIRAAALDRLHLCRNRLHQRHREGNRPAIGRSGGARRDGREESKGGPEICSRSALFSATDPQIPEYCELLKADEWLICAFISQDCRPTNPSEEAHSVEASLEVWEETLEMIGLPSDAVEKLLEGKEVKCRYGTQND
ncbi:NAD(P)-binding Rossmann-fold superfamily protein isoform 3 [Hibiscus syriacus]|uniref:NAD(P)-binding Rossmann-fold superfamily protein isoform 3 n=1 Tax=Hibiscus syriacus TaxID=106335 RepID=A0A6A3BYD3_HIBSY|nr:NAD(P)-binding Rossmann-fold superfamily protein isoform 3 [Hibiscus syriacus]